MAANDQSESRMHINNVIVALAGKDW